MLLRLILAAAVASCALGASCKGPKHTASYFTTTDAFFHFSTTYIVEFVLNCQNDVQEMPVYAVISGKDGAVQAAISEETTKYQVSWQEEHKDAHSANIKVDIFDEDGYSTYRKAQRSNTDTGSVKPMFTIEVKHPGVSKGFFIASETVVTILAALLFYVAITLRNSLES